MDVGREVIRAREAYERREWITAYRTLSNLDKATLAAADFAVLADAAELLGNSNDAIQAFQRAHHRALEAAEPLIAIRAAARLAMILALKGETAVAGGWLASGERLLAEIGGDVVERGYLLIGRMFERIGVGDLEGAAQLPQQIIDLGRRHGDPNLVAMGLNQLGRVMTVFGRVAEGVRMLDEAMTGVVSGEADDPLITGEVYCSMIEACQWVGDWSRAAQWTRALTTWCDEQIGLVAFTGQCAVHRAQLMRFHGEFDDAIVELERAVACYESGGGHGAVALAYAEQGDVLRVMGHLDAADRVYADAVIHGEAAQPGRALLSLNRGDTGRAEAAAVRVLDAVQGAIFRHRLIPGCVEILVAAGRTEEASALAVEMESIADAFGSAALRAAAESASARVDIAQGDPESALSAATSALHHWLKLDAAYEAARSRVLVARAFKLLGDDDAAELDLRIAKAAFEAQGAVVDAREVAVLLGTVAHAGGLTNREVDVLRLVAAGCSNAEIASELHLSIKTVARHLSNIFAKLDVRSRTQAVAAARRHGVV